jgi:hypothetical protein
MRFLGYQGNADQGFRAVAERLALPHAVAATECGTILFSWSFDSFIHSSDCAPLVSNYLQGELKAAPIERVVLPRRFPLTPELNGNAKTQL